MEITNYCLNCFNDKGTASVICPHCGFDERADRRQPFHIPPRYILAERYIIGRVVDYGGFGITYRAWDMTLGIAVAIKEYFPNGYATRIPGEIIVATYTGEKEREYKDGLVRFRDEAKSLARFLENPNIVNVRDVFNANNTAYIVMEFMDGITLKSYLDMNGKMSYADTFSIISPIMDALTAMHKKNIVHRDVAPDNIMLIPANDGSSETTVKLYDFGAARIKRSEKENIMTENPIIKIGYSAPEQYTSRGRMGVWTDVYELGATIYHMLTGVRPAESNDRQEKDDLELPSVAGAEGLPPNAERAVMKAMALRKRTRFKSVEDMKHAFADKKRVDYPWVEEKKYRRRMTALGVTLGLIILGILGGIGAYVSTIILHPAFVAEDAITVWVPDDGYGSYDDAEAIAEEFTSTRKGNSKYKIDLVSISEDEYAERLLEAVGTDEFPDLFRSDYLDQEMLDGNAADLAALYYNLTIDDYMYLGAYKNNATKIEWDHLWQEIQRGNIELRNPDHAVRTVPVSFKVPVLYVNLSLARDLGIEIPASIDAAALDDFMKTKAVILGSGDGINTAAEALGIAIVDAQISDDPYSILKNDKALAYFGTSDELVKIQEAMPGYYGVVSFTGENGQAYYSMKWSVSAASDENARKLAMYYIMYNLTDYAQQTICRESMPLNITALSEYVFGTNSKDLGFVADICGLTK